MRENYIEKVLRQEVKRQGGWCLKFVSPGTAGVPDRICILPGGVLAFVETKAPGRDVAKDGLQAFWQTELCSLGQKAYVVSTPQGARELARELGRFSKEACGGQQPGAPGKRTAAALRRAAHAEL